MASDKAYDTKQRLDARITGVPAILGITDVTTTGTKTLAASADTIPAAALAGGEHFECDAAGTFSTGNPAPTAISFFVYYGSVATGTQINGFVMPAAGLWISASGQPWTLHADVVWLSATESVVTIELSWRTAAGIASSIRWHNYTDTTAVDTTTARSLTLAAAFTGTGLTLHTDYVHWTRKR